MLSEDEAPLFKSLLKKWPHFHNFVQEATKDKNVSTRNNLDSVEPTNDTSIILSILRENRQSVYEECGFDADSFSSLDDLLQKVEKSCLLKIVNLYETFKLRSSVERMAACTVDLTCLANVPFGPMSKKSHSENGDKADGKSHIAENEALGAEITSPSSPSPNHNEMGRGRRKKFAKVKFEFNSKDSTPTVHQDAVRRKISQSPAMKEGKVVQGNVSKKTGSKRVLDHEKDGNTKQCKAGNRAKKRALESTPVTNTSKKIKLQHNSSKDFSQNKRKSASKTANSPSITPKPLGSSKKKSTTGEDFEFLNDMKADPKTMQDKENGPAIDFSSDSINKDEDKGVEVAVKKESIPQEGSSTDVFEMETKVEGQGGNLPNEPDEKQGNVSKQEETAEVQSERESQPDKDCENHRLGEQGAAAESNTEKDNAADSNTEKDNAADSNTEKDEAADSNTEKDNAADSNTEKDGAAESNTEKHGAADSNEEKDCIENESKNCINDDNVESKLLLGDDSPDAGKKKKGRGPQRVPRKLPWNLVPIVCAVCKTRYSTYSTLRRHWAKMHAIKSDQESPPNLLLCTVCMEVFNCPRTFLKHYREHAAEQEVPTGKFEPVKFTGERTDFECDRLAPITCSICKKQMAGEGIIYNHWKREHKTEQEKKPPPLFQCDKCDQCFDAPRRFKLHYRIHTGAKPHECTMCPKKFRTFNDLNSHMLCHSLQKSFKCEICNKAFIAQKVLNRHMKGHLSPWVCEVCGKTYPTRYSLSLHTKIHTGEKPHKCEFCGVAFTQAGSLKLHRRLHLGEKPHVCETCGMRFNSLSHLRTHRRVHTGEKPYKCDKCSYAAASSSRLKDHLTVHRDEKPHVCKVPGCGRRYKRLSHLIFHHSKHTGVKPYVCNRCGMSFKLSSSLTLHKRQDACLLNKDLHQPVKDEWSEEQLKQEVGTTYSVVIDPEQKTPVAIASAEEPVKEEQEAVTYIYQNVEPDIQQGEPALPQTIEVADGEMSQVVISNGSPEDFEQQIVIQIVREPGQEDEDFVLSKEELERIVRLSQEMS